MRDFDDIPKPTDLMDHPQLAVLVALRASLVGAIHMLLSVHTDLLEDTFPRTVTEQDYWAERLIDLGRQLEMALTKYRAVVREEISICQEDFF